MIDGELQRSLEIRIDVAQRDAHIAARDPSARAQLRQNRRRAVDRHREADAARARADRGVDADHFAARVDERSAAVAEVDRGVGLNVIVQAHVEQLPSEEADHADGDGVFVAERIADRAHPLAHPQRRGVAERRHGQPRLSVDLDQRDIGVRVGSDDARAHRAAVRQFHGDALGAIDDVVVGEDAAVGVDDEPAAGAAVRTIAVLARAELERFGRIGNAGAIAAPPRLAAARGRVDVDHSGVDALDDVREIDGWAEDGRGPRHEPGRRRFRLRPGLDRRARDAAREDRADQESDERGERDGDERKAPRHVIPFPL